MKKIILSAVFIAVLLFSCSIKEQNPYENSNIPKIDRSWSHLEYSKTFQLIQSSKVPVPVLSNRYGKKIFMKITDVSNFDHYKDSKRSFSKRYKEFTRFYSFIEKFLFLYGDKIGKGEKLNEELARIYCFGLYSNEFLIRLLNDSKYKNFSEIDYELRSRSMKLITEGNIESFNVAVNLLYVKDFSKKEYSLILKAMSDTLPSVKRVFPKGFSKRLKEDLKKHLPRFESNDKKMILAMIDQLKEV